MGCLKRKKRTVAAVAVLLFTMILLSACGGTQDKASSSPSPAGTKEPAKTTGQSETASASAKKELKTVADVALYQGADREQKLLDAAKKEGVINMYTSMNLEDANPLAAAFEKKYGVKVNIWRSNGETVVQRAVTEAKANRFDMDIMETAGAQLEMLAREKLTQEFYSPSLKDIPSSAVPKHKQWVASRMNFFVMAYNTNAVKTADVPKSYEDLLDPKWKGKVSIESEDIAWFAMFSKVWGERKASEYFTKLSAQKLILRKGHTLIAELVVSGELPLSLTVYNHKAEQLKQKGAPIDWKPLEPTVAEPSGVLLAKNAPHPNASMLFIDFLLSHEGQQILADRQRVPVNTKIDTGLNKFPYVMSDPVIQLDEYKKWDELFTKVILRK